MTKDILDRNEAIEFLGVSKSTLYVLVARGVLPKQVSAFGRGMGGQRVYFLRKDLEAIKSKGFPESKSFAVGAKYKKMKNSRSVKA